ncbi:uncharacterized protein N7483_007748 [Penicillium malachiteum]|uniref:uncharacterized protein n=1 Tax=Penicillium malachiteum TaxID=1324776 RepID=UPI0025479DEE|nr:uncharacterized protein N7483_007748 [Penicillium malachiteum]KAJ5726391.1 hypothetical protein N7483_007748 [Penicillium malachiteum]
MSEINVVAVLHPKPEKLKEVTALVTDIVKKVQENEPDTLLYYAFHVPETNEIVIVERYKYPEAVRLHVKAPYFQDFAAKIPGWSSQPWELRAGAFLGIRGVSRL